MGKGHAEDAISTAQFARTKSDGNQNRPVLLRGGYTNLLLQHHSALTAGLIRLYSRLLEGKGWDGAPVDEVNGSPSVHCILERIGVIGADEEFDEDLDTSDHNERPQLAPIKEASAPAGVKKPAKSKPHHAAAKRRSQSRVSSIQTEPESGIDKSRNSSQHVRGIRLASPSNSEMYSTVFESGSSDTPSTWESPGFADELFSASATNGDAQIRYERDMDTTFPTEPSFPTQHHQLPDANLNAQSTAPLPFDSGFEMQVTDNFVDATCDMNFYDWDGNNSFGIGTEPGLFVQRNNTWNPSVFA
ncbi:hypothetical protein PV08_00730 [Exophiala spinifera]|uniref:Uncharacterized protein n=1 Tax=Exophiala spinifera TaxID=91928 RepID=A0A0D2BNP2_9EURO|nr:uncharacterized protein PV08_00730 [Exophiala spinifera]KIW20155.1 hypothetical protein PV08_00730 [Exophiala spinifera]